MSLFLACSLLLGVRDGEIEPAVAGFEAELVVAAPNAVSWEAFAFDARGRALAADPGGALWWIEPAGEGAPRATVLELELRNVRALTWTAGAFHAVTGEEDGGLWRLAAVDGDGRPERSELVARAPAGTRLWALSSGPAGEWLVAGETPSWSPEIFGCGTIGLGRLDRCTLESAGSGLGWIARVDAGRLALVASGLCGRSVLAFDARGEPFALDSAEGRAGGPSGAPARLVHVVERADFGHRGGFARWPEWFPDAWPGLAEAGEAAPTSLASGWSTAFADPWRDALYAADADGKRVLAFPLACERAEVRAEARLFARTGELVPQALAAGPDGALWLAAAGEDAGLYRIRAEATAPTRSEPDGLGAQRWLREHRRLWSAQPLERGALERLIGPTRELALVVRTALEELPDAELPSASRVAELAQQGEAALARELELVLVRAGPAEEVRAWLERVAQEPLPSDPAARLGRTRALELALLRTAPLPVPTRARLAEGLLVALDLASGDARLEHELGVLLASLPETEERLVPRALARLEAAADGAEADCAEAFPWAVLLARARGGWSQESRRRYFAWIRSAEERVGRPELAALRLTASSTLDAAERAALGELLVPGGR